MDGLYQETNRKLDQLTYDLRHLNTGFQNYKHRKIMKEEEEKEREELLNRRFTPNGAHKRILDIASTLGLSNTVIRLIDKRATQDKWIVFGGMIVTCIIMFLVVKYLT
ncbi:Golgi SNAP receptor complex member 2 [Acropora cervicornis]|uniref:Golgi SNAP receptor complex member 2 n=1 Tax=Acropora cervicornis TaxID=6130 RepID=A0AAD9Q410_ACRCE|nr:Golgi SNAP receptor complex member 2 [Acropora cervicornis]